MVIIITVFVILIVYFIPSVTALLLNHPEKVEVFKTNLFLGWSVLFWFFALKTALGKENSDA